MFPGLRKTAITARDVSLAIRTGGSGPPVLLLHGFPETHLMWRDIAPRLARRFTVVCADLRGYGESDCPPSAPDHGPYSKRAMAGDMITLMAQLGHEQFHVVGHDRGGRVGYRLALDHPDAVRSLTVLDVLPTETVWEHADDRFALAFWPWSLLAQDSPLPEALLQGAADAVLEAALGGWGTPPQVFPPEVRSAYLAMLRDPAHAHAICEEYRAAATLDREDDRESRRAGRQITCPMLALWSGSGPLGTWYEAVGGPLALWKEWAPKATGREMPGGHFFPEEDAAATADALEDFLAHAS